MKIIVQRGTGVGNMGDVSDSHSVARFSYARPYGLLYLRATFSEAVSGNGAAGDATMQLRLDQPCAANDFYDFILAQWVACGLGADATSFVNWRLRDDELPAWILDAWQEFVLEWINPETTGKMRWAVELGLYEVTPRLDGVSAGLGGR